MSVLAKWCAAVVVGLLHEEQEPLEWKELHVGAERCINCDPWEWQEDRRDCWMPGFFRCKTACVASVDVKMAFDVAKPTVVSQILTIMGTHGHVVAALFEEMKDVTGSACFENGDGVSPFETYSARRCRGSSVAEESGQIRAVESRKEMEGQGMGDRFRRGVMWADSCWLFSDDRDKLAWMVNDVVEESLDLAMEPKPGSLW